MMNKDNYLYDIIEDYRLSGSEEERKAIFNGFCSLLWSAENKRKVFTRTIRFSVRANLRDTDVGQLFDACSSVTYKSCRSVSRETDWCSLLRQKINNLYTRYFDREVILNRDYMDLLKTPKRLYLKWAAGEDMQADDVASTLYAAANKASELRILYRKQKMDLSWADYKTLTEGFLEKILRNCKSIDAYETQAPCGSMYDFMNEDNFYIRYFCKSLEGALLKWQKQYYHVRDHQKYKRCALCGSLIENTGNRKTYCAPCAKQKAAKDALLRKQKQRSGAVTK